MGYPKGRPQSPESVAKRAAAIHARWQDPEYRGRMTARLVARTQSAAAAASRAETMKALAASGGLEKFQAAARAAETKEKARIGRAAALKTPEVREKQRRATKARMAAGTWNADFAATSNSPEATVKRLATFRASGAMARAVVAMGAVRSNP